MTRIVIRHTAGSKANQVEEFQLEQLEEMVIGRDPQACVRFDPDKDDLVSRRHARITREPGERLSFRIVDLNSSNGLFVNGTRVMGESALLPGDEVHLGADGPRFVFDVEPRPDYMIARTRVFVPGDLGVPSGKVTTMSPSVQAPDSGVAPQPGASPENRRSSIGRATVERLVAYQGRVSRRVLYGTAAGTLGLVLVGGGVLYAAQQSGAHALENQLGAQIRSNGAAVQAASAEAGRTQGRILEKYGAKTPREIAQDNADAVVMIHAAWKLFDNSTGKQLFHKYVTLSNNRKVPAYVRVDGSIFYWLTTDDQNGENKAIGTVADGSGFVVSNNGFVMTNKHVAAGWLRPYQVPENGVGVVFNVVRDPKATDPGSGHLNDVSTALGRWVPKGGFVFEQSVPRMMYNGQPHPFIGHDDTEVLFPRNKIGTKAHFIRASDRKDVAMIKVDMPDILEKVQLAPRDYKLKLGEPISVLGYPAVSVGRKAYTKGSDLTGATLTLATIPEPTLTNGIIAKVNSADVSPTTPDQNVVMVQELEDYFQLTDTATGAGNSGGPIFNSEGQVIGIFTAFKQDEQGTRVTLGIPIKYGWEIYGRNPAIAEQ